MTITVDVDLDLLAEIVSVRFLHYKVILSPPFSMLLSLGKSQQAPPTLREGRLTSSLQEALGGKKPGRRKLGNQSQELRAGCVG